MSKAPNTYTDYITISAAAFVVGDEDNPVTDTAIRNAARRNGLLETDANGQYVIARSVALRMRDCYRATGWLLPRQKLRERQPLVPSDGTRVVA